MGGKVQRLVSSDMKPLSAEFAQSPSTVLRALHTWEQVGGNGALERSFDEIARCFSPVFSLPFFRSKSANAELESQVLYQARFSLELLHQEGLIGADGKLQNLAVMVAHLFEAEPANILLSHVLCSGALHAFLKDQQQYVKKDQRRTHLTVRLASVLGWFFQRQRLPAGLGSKVKRTKHLPSEGCPYLPPLPDQILKQLEDYNHRVFELFQQLSWCVSSTKVICEEDLKLPFSRRIFQDGFGDKGDLFLENSTYKGMLKKQHTKFRARSPFAALSGSGDQFRTPTDLISSARNVMHMDLNMLPMIPPPAGEDISEGLELTNSWAVDFLCHGKLKYLVDDNGLRATKAWALSQKFIESVNMSVAAMKCFAKADDIVLKTFEELGQEMSKMQKEGS